MEYKNPELLTVLDLELVEPLLRFNVLEQIPWLPTPAISYQLQTNLKISIDDYGILHYTEPPPNIQSTCN